MNIKTSDLRAFQKLASGLKSNNILPIYDYLLFDKGCITKMTAGGFVVFEVSDINETVLVDEKLLYAKLANTSAAVINITQKEKKVTLTDGITPTSFQSPNAKEWPAMPDYLGERSPISNGFNLSLQKAIHFPAHSEQTPTIAGFVMVGNGYICASDGFIFFSEPIEEDITLVIATRHAAMLSKIPLIGCRTSDNWMFFYSNGATYGFQKQEIGFTDMSRFFLQKGLHPEFTGSLSDFKAFNSECIGSLTSPFITISTGLLSVNDSNFDIQLNRQLEYLTPKNDFTYSPANMNRLLNSFNTDTLEFYRGDKWYWIKSPDEQHTTLLIQISMQ